MYLYYYTQFIYLIGKYVSKSYRVNYKTLRTLFKFDFHLIFKLLDYKL